MATYFSSAHVGRCAILAVLTLTCHSLKHEAFAQEPVIVRVEEDWELVVKTPDSNSAAPQIVCTIAPNCSISGTHATFELNHQSQPFYVAGGLHLLAWNNGTPTTHSFPQSSVLSKVNETIRWTQTMTVVDGTLRYEVVNGTSHTWSDFGGSGYLLASTATSLVDLNAYTPDFSVQNSGVGYAANRVESLVLKRVRLITDTGVVLEDDSPRTVYPTAN